MDEERIDLTPLDALSDDARRARLEAAILARAEPELTRRAAVGPILALARWARPAFAAAAALAVASAALLSIGRDAAEPAAGPVAGVTDALEVPAPLNAWILADRDPTVGDVLIALEGEVP